MIKYIGILLLFVGTLQAQDLSGKWVAMTRLSDNYYAELYLVKNLEGSYAGHSYDTEQGGYCRHFLEADFNLGTSMLEGRDVELIQKSSTHEATKYFLRYEKKGDQEFLIGRQPIYSLENYNRMLEYYKDYYGKDFDLSYLDDPYEQLSGKIVTYIKVSPQYKVYSPEQPNIMGQLEMELMKYEHPESIIEEFETPEIADVIEDEIIVEEISIEEIEPEIESPDNEIYTEEVEETDAPIVTNAPIVTEATVEMDEVEQKRNERTDQLVSDINIASKKVTLLVRDYGTEDNDSISIFYNDKILAKNLRITKDAHEFELEIDPNRKNELVFVADNLGDIPPNTARIAIISDEGKRYNYKLFTDEENNAVISLTPMLTEEP